MHSKVKARQSIKLQKENENIKLRKKIKGLSTDKHLTDKKETVWDRLSKVKKLPSTDLRAMKSRPIITSKNSQHFQTFKQLPTTSFMKKPSNMIKKCCFQTPSVGIEKQSFLHIEPIKEIMTARSFSNESKSLIEPIKEIMTARSFSNESKSLINSKLGSSEVSNEEYELAPLINSASSIVMLNNVRKILHQEQKCMTLDDIKLVNDIIKSDSRYRNLDQNPEILKDILKTELQNALKHEFAIKKVLNSLEASASLEQNLSVETTKPINKEALKFEVDIIFKNVPSLDKEIEILRALGEKLEATLKSSTVLRKNNDDLESTSSSISENKNQSAMYKVRHELYVLTGKYNAEVSVHQVGIRLHTGIINEFHMTQKTIVELKQESSRSFYILSNSESLQLKRTSFKKLKETPSEFLRYLKPKKSKIAFNIIEQDPVFFNKLFNKSIQLWGIPYDFSKNFHYTEKNQLMAMKHSLCEGGDSVLLNQLKDETLIHFTNDSNYNPLRDPITTSSTFESPIRGNQRRRIRRYLTPMPTSTSCNPKNTLFKTVLVGFVQMSVFLIFIVALTYPDVKC